MKKGQTVKIISDNESYIPYLDIPLRVVRAVVGGLGYDMGVYPEKLCNLEVVDTWEQLPFSLYEYELKLYKL